MRNVILVAFAASLCAWPGSARPTDLPEAARPADRPEAARPADRPGLAGSGNRPMVLAQAGSLALDSKSVVLQNCLITAVKKARLATDRPGVLAMIELKEGDPVHEKQPVARLMDEVAKASYEVAKLVAEDYVEIEFAKKKHELDSVEYRKNLEANRYHLNTVPEIDVLRAKLEMQKSELQIDKATHDVEVNKLKAKQADAEWKTYQIVAPFDGVVTKISKFRGEAVRQGDTILEIVNTDTVQVEANVDEQEIWNVKVGCPVNVRLSFRGAELEIGKQVFRGRIGFVDVVADGASRKTRVWAEVANPNNVLRPGLRATMIILPLSDDAGQKTP